MKKILIIGLIVLIALYIRVSVGYFGGTGSCLCEYEFTMTRKPFYWCKNLCFVEPQMTTKQKIANAFLLKPEGLIFDTGDIINKSFQPLPSNPDIGKPINPSDQECTANEDCTWAVLDCKSCSCGTPINNKYKGKYNLLYGEKCKNYSGPVCDFYCPYTVKCINNACTPQKRPEADSAAPVPSNEVLKLVIVTVKIDPPWQPEGNLTPERQEEQKAAITKVINEVLSGLDASKVYARWEGLPSFAIKADKQTLEYLSSHPLVVSIQEDKLSSPN